MLAADKKPHWGEYPLQCLYCTLLKETRIGKRRIAWQAKTHSDSLLYSAPVYATERLHSFIVLWLYVINIVCLLILDTILGIKKYKCASAHHFRAFLNYFFVFKGTITE